MASEEKLVNICFPLPFNLLRLSSSCSSSSCSPLILSSSPSFPRLTLIARGGGVTRAKASTLGRKAELMRNHTLPNRGQTSRQQSAGSDLRRLLLPGQLVEHSA